MAKIDFEKVEMSFITGVKKMAVTKLQDLAARIGDPNAGEVEPEGLHIIDKERSRKQIVQALHCDLKKLHAKDNKIWANFDMSKSEIQRCINHPDELDAVEWVQLKKIKKQVERHKEELLAPLEEGLNEGIVENQRTVHHTKRFNIRENWLPLH